MGWGRYTPPPRPATSSNLQRGGAGPDARLPDPFDETAEVGAEQRLETMADLPREPWAAAARGDGDLERAAAEDGGDDEVAVGGVVDHVDERAVTPGRRGDRAIDAGVAGGREDHGRAASVPAGKASRAGLELSCRRELREARRQRRAHHGHDGAALEQVSRLALADGSAAHDETAPAAEVEKGGEVFRHLTRRRGPGARRRWRLRQCAARSAARTRRRRSGP